MKKTCKHAAFVAALFALTIAFIACPSPTSDDGGNSDTTKPTVTTGAAGRTSDTAGWVKFTSNEAGHYYYAIVEGNAGAPAIDTTGDGTACGTSEVTVNLTLTAGAKDVYLAVKDAAGNVSDAVRFDVPANDLTAPSNAAAKDIKAKWGITDNTTTDGVTAAFNKVHEFIQGKNSDQILAGIKPGDYIDLVSLSVEPYYSPSTAINDREDGQINATNTPINPTTPPYEGYEGTLLRLIVVGVNSFNGLNGNGTTPHVVFQFQNLPGLHRMNATTTNAGGYGASEMRKYLYCTANGTTPDGNYWKGLQEAGVPDEVVWAVRREVGAKGNQSEGAATEIIMDKLWLPTVYEMQAEVGATNETVANQASFASYYTEYAHRIKYISNSSAQTYFEASPYSYSGGYFCYMGTNGNSGHIIANGPVGCAPAFCVN